MEDPSLSFNHSSSYSFKEILMSFTGKATYTAGATLPEIAEDVSDLVAIASPIETPLLDALGDAPRAAHSTVHEWLEDALVPQTDTVNDVVDADTIGVDHADRFRVGDQIRVEGEVELILVTGVDTVGGELTITRSYGGSTAGSLSAGDILRILGNAALEGDDADAARVTSRSRKSNYTQIFSVTVEVSGSELAVRQIGLRDELDYSKAMRTSELLRDLEACVITGIAPTVNPQGSGTVRRTMRGIIPFLTSNQFEPGAGGFPAGAALTENQLNAALRSIWQNSSGSVDLIVVGGPEKRAINQFVASNRRFTSQSDTYRDLVSVYESDFGVCRVVLCRSVPAGTVLLLDSSRIDVMNLAGRSFHYKPLASAGDREGGQIIGEYTLELRNENAHGIIRGFTG
jgi:hypothetical protein